MVAKHQLRRGFKVAFYSGATFRRVAAVGVYADLEAASVQGAITGGPTEVRSGCRTPTATS